MRILGTIDICGDSHADFRQIYRWVTISKVANLIHVGDFGAFNQNIDRVVWLGNECNKAGKRIYVIRGNHESPEFFDNRIYGGEYGGVQLVKDGTIAEWNGEHILFVGGGISLDREFRKVDLDYWVDEAFKIPRNLFNSKIKVDHLITHVTLGEVSGKFITDPFVLAFCGNDAELMTDLEREQRDVKALLDYLLDGCGNKIKSWHYGHYHKSIHSQYRGIECRGLAIDEIRPFNRKEY